MRKMVIDSSMASPWVRRTVIIVEEFSGFPRCIARIIAEYCMIPKLLPWIDQSLIDEDILGENPKSVEAGLINIRIQNAWTASNPEFAEIIKANFDEWVNQEYIWGNPALFDWLREKYPEMEPDCDGLDTNTNPNVIKYLLDNGMPVTKFMSRNNPIAFEYFREILSPSEVSKLYGNPAAIDYLGDFTGHGEALSQNSHPRAIEYLRNHQEEISWWGFSSNPGIFEYRVDPKLLELLSE